MKLGYKYFRNSLIKLTILSIAMPFVLWGYFTGRDKGTEPGAIYLHIFLWVAGTGFLVWQMKKAKRREREGGE
jgi:hypothetical protein